MERDPGDRSWGGRLRSFRREPFPGHDQQPQSNKRPAYDWRLAHTIAVYEPPPPSKWSSFWNSVKALIPLGLTIGVIGFGVYVQSLYMHEQKDNVFVYGDTAGPSQGGRSAPSVSWSRRLAH